MDHILEPCRCCLNQLLNSEVSFSNASFKELCTSIANIISVSFNANPFTISKYVNAKDCSYKYLLMFQLTQIISALRLLADVITNECRINLILKECRKSLYKRISFCLDTINENFSSDLRPANQSGCFLRWMDDALEKIKLVDSDSGKEIFHKNFQEATFLFEDVLSHAMSIAQVCLNEDCKAIKGSSQGVLEALEELKNELNKYEPNKAMTALFVDVCGDKLCALERKVDIAVLKLSLKIFSQYLLPLENIFNFCEENSGNVFDQQAFDDIVADFDLHVDRIMQIGLFAIFCSSNIKNGIKIRSCMASLEYLELELIPVTQLLLSDGCEIKRTSAVIFKNYWINQAKELKTLIFEIIDPFAFCQVINDGISVELDALLNRYENKKNFSKSFFESFVQLGTVLTDFLLTAIKGEDITDEPSVKNIIQNCCVVMKEIKRAVQVLDDNSCETNQRILKRSKVFKAQIRKLELVFIKDKRKEAEENEQNISSQGEEDIHQNRFLKHVIERGKKIHDNRSILYRTPNKSLQYKITCLVNSGKRKTKDLEAERHKLTFSFDSSYEDQSFKIHITEILENLSDLSTTQLI